MKLIAVLIFLATTVFSQQKSQVKNDSIYIKKSIDEMSETVYFFPSRELVVSGKDKRQGVILSAFIEERGETDELSIIELSAKMINIGICVDKNELIIMFEDSSKIKLKSWNDFNCDGNAWFNLSNSDIEKLSNLKILKIQIQNGYTFDTFTSSLSKPDYYLQLFYAIRNKKIKRVK